MYKTAWAQVSTSLSCQFSRGDSGPEPFILLEADCLKDFMDLARLFGLQLAATGSNDVKRIRYKQAHEAAKKDMERAFGVLKKKWSIVRTPARSRSLKRITHLMYTCIILHNMIRKEKGNAISPDFYPDEQHREDDPVRSAQDRLQEKGNAISPDFYPDEQHREDDPVRSAQDRLRVIKEIHDEETHLNLKADLVEHIWHRTNAN
ncbi:putative nuclease HARBI1 isoform X2 [Tanacetum coccineum]